jgi:prolipoprotein diacylglyceryltransferase
MFNGGSFHLVYFGLFAALGAMAALSLFCFYLHTRDLFEGLTVLPVALAFTLGDMVGVKALYYISLGREFFRNPKHYLNETTMYNQGGLMGMTLIGIGVALIYSINPLIMFDAMVIACSFALFLGRLGCYNYGCCFGKPTSSHVHVTYHFDSSKIIRTNPELKNVPLVPTQLYTAYFDLFMFFVFAGIVWIYPADGLISLMFVLLFNGFRIFIQKYRFTEPSDMLNYTRIAAGYFIMGLTAWLLLFFVSGGELIARPLQNPFSVGAWVNFVCTAPGMISSMLIIGIVVFAFYGVHGRKLGTHVNLSDQ